MDDSMVISVITLVFIFLLSCTNGQELLDSPLNWFEANERCNLSSEYENNTIPPGYTVWIRKRWDFTNWLEIEDCDAYTFDVNLSTEIEIEGQNLVFECQEECSKLFEEQHNRFGIKLNGKKCVCDNPKNNPNFGERIATCEPVKCRPFDDGSLDLCGDNGIVIHNEMNDVIFSGSGECAAFRRTSNASFEMLALSCYEKHGYLQLTTGSKQFSAITTQKLSWIDTVFNASVDDQQPTRISKRTRQFASRWSAISLEQWPLNITLWVAATRRSKLRQTNDESPCKSGSCYCVAVHVNTSGTQLEKLMDCSTTLPALCTQGSIMSVVAGGSTTPTFDWNSTEARNEPPTEPSAVNEGRITIIVTSPVVVILVVILAVFFLLRRYKKKQKAQESETNAETRPTSIYYSEIHSVKSMKMKRSREDAVINETNFDDGEYDEIGRDGKRRDISVGDETYSHARKPKEFNSNEYYSTSDSVKHIYDHAHGKTST